MRWFPTSGAGFMTLSQPEDICGHAAFEPTNRERGARYVQSQISKSGTSYCQFGCHVERAVRAGLRPMWSPTRAATWLLLSLMVMVFYKESVLWFSERLLRATAWKQFLGMLASATGGERWSLAVCVLSCVASTAWSTFGMLHSFSEEREAMMPSHCHKVSNDSQPEPPGVPLEYASLTAVTAFWLIMSRFRPPVTLPLVAPFLLRLLRLPPLSGWVSSGPCLKPGSFRLLP